MPSPGWYPDPSGAHEHRYHDGGTWTEHVSDGGVASTAPMPPAWPPPGAAAPRPPGPPGAPGWGAPPAPGYGAPGWPGVAREHPDGTTVLVLGILSLVVCGILGPIAWVKGNHALAEIDAPGGTWSNRGQVQAGRICGIIATVFLALGLLFFLVLIVVAIASSNSTT